MDESTEPLTETVVASLKQAAINGRVSLSELDQAIQDASVGVPEVAVEIDNVLEALGQAGIGVDEEVDEVELAKEATMAARCIDADDHSPLDAYHLYQKMLDHRILSREEEVRLSAGYRLDRHMADALYAAAEGLEARIAEVRVELSGDGLNPSVRQVLEADVQRLISQLASHVSDARRSESDAHRVEGTFIAHNQRLIFAVARRMHDAAGRRTEILDLVQEGNLAVIRAFRKFDPSRGFKFSTLATLHIRGAMSVWLYEQVGPVRVPIFRWLENRKIDTFGVAFEADQGRAPTVKEIAENEHKSVGAIERTLATRPLRQIESLDATISDEVGSATRGEGVADVGSLTTEQRMDRIAQRDTIAAACDRVLDARERRLVQLRYGLEDEAPRTLEWIGHRLNLSRERIRQKLSRALAKLSKDDEIRALRG